jgi:hypothetical protein
MATFLSKMAQAGTPMASIPEIFGSTLGQYADYPVGLLYYVGFEVLTAVFSA